MVSPDGKLVAYAWRNGPYPGYSGVNLHVTGIDGTGARTLCSHQGYDYVPLSWSSNSRLVAMRRYGGGEGTAIALVSVADGSVRVLKTVAPSWSFLSFSPDNRYLAYDFPVAEDGGKYDISLLALDGSGEIPLVHHPADDRLFGWIPGTQEILFSSDRSGSLDLWATRFKDGKSEGISEPLKRAFGSFERRLGFARDGSYYFSLYTRHFALQVVPFDPVTGKFQLGSGRTLVGSNHLPDWSPDGERLAYVAEFEKGNRQRLHVRDLKTGEEREFAPDFQVLRPRWSPDGRSILIFGYDEKQKQESHEGGIYEVQVADGRVTPVVLFTEPQPSKSAFCWTHDGESIVYNDRGCLRMRELKSGKEKQLCCHPNFGLILALSIHGETLAFSTIEKQENTVSLLSMSGAHAEPRKLFTALGLVGNLVWTPDGRHLLYTNLQNNFEVLYRISRDGGSPEDVWRSTKSRPAGLSGLSFHPNGKQVAISTYVQESETCVIENLRKAGARP